MSRPEHQAPPELYYNETEAQKYTQNTRMIEIQNQMSERCLELLALPDDDVPRLLLDIGCGSGLSGSVLEENGHHWIGLDISPHMLAVARDREVEGDVLLTDLGQGIPFRAGTFDGAISVSALQWLCNADKTSHRPVQRLYQFFTSLYSALSRTARAVFQFYPESSSQAELITLQATKAGFQGGLVVDYPNSTKAKKYYLVLMTGGILQLPEALGDDFSINQARREQIKFARGKPLKKSRDWILQKKERRRNQDREVRADTKYTGRKRSGRGRF